MTTPVHGPQARVEPGSAGKPQFCGQLWTSGSSPFMSIISGNMALYRRYWTRPCIPAQGREHRAFLV